MPNIAIIAPPNTGSGMIFANAPSLGIQPHISNNTTMPYITLFFLAPDKETSPTFCE